MYCCECPYENNCSGTYCKYDNKQTELEEEETEGETITQYKKGVL